jgi:lipopolysaccharide export system protein LptA
MRILIILFFIFISLNSKEMDVDIQADSFLANKQKNLVVFTGNVSMVRGEDTLVCQKLTVHTKTDPDTNATIAKQYIAIGNVSLTIKRPDTLLIGNGDKVNYDIDKQIYIITGNAYLEDKNGSKTLRGEKIYIDEKTGNTKIDGKKNKPVKFKFKMKSKDK